jgi:hypothetical protein
VIVALTVVWMVTKLLKHLAQVEQENALRRSQEMA